AQPGFRQAVLPGPGPGRLAALAQHGRMGRKEIDELLWNKLPDWMNDKQKRIKVMNLLSELRRKGVIHNAGSNAKPSWALIPPSETP
ncbi:MAG TPA: hypothetical protein VN931_08115, partial [Fibrobacteria bacterium]|nr:hypothetical protein [Fibrobacteria bacterium]